MQKTNSDKIEMEGEVQECLPNAQFRIKLTPGDHLVLGYLSGSMVKNRIKVLLGDRVLIQLSTYDLGKGRITRRLASGGFTPPPIAR